jgi:hypothetical protein
MSFNFERLPDEPIMIVTFHGKIEAHVLVEVNQQVRATLMQHPVNSALILDTTQSTTAFADTLEMVRQNAEHQADAARQSPIKVQVALVGTSAMAKLYVSAAQQERFGGQKLPLFVTLDDALTAMRIALAQLPEPRRVP